MVKSPDCLRPEHLSCFRTRSKTAPDDPIDNSSASAHNAECCKQPLSLWSAEGSAEGSLLVDNSPASDCCLTDGLVDNSPASDCCLIDEGTPVSVVDSSEPRQHGGWIESRLHWLRRHREGWV